MLSATTLKALKNNLFLSNTLFAENTVGKTSVSIGSRTETTEGSSIRGRAGIFVAFKYLTT